MGAKDMTEEDEICSGCDDDDDDDVDGVTFVV
jgi:hypothetical protein